MARFPDIKQRDVIFIITVPAIWSNASTWFIRDDVVQACLFFLEEGLKIQCFCAKASLLYFKLLNVYILIIPQKKSQSLQIFSIYVVIEMLTELILCCFFN